MKKKKSMSFIIAVWLFAVAFLLFSFAQMQNYANIINDAGIVRGGTQRIIKLELNSTPNDEVITKVSALLKKLQENEENNFFKTSATVDFIQKLEAVQQQWDITKKEIVNVRSGGDGEKLLFLSEEHFKLADAAVLSAQVRAETEFKRSVLAIVLLIGFASVFMFLLELNGRKSIKRIFYTDFITNQDNIQAFTEKTGALLKNASPGSYILLYSNLNNFKFVNQSYGHEMGDRLIKLLSTSLQRVCEGDEICAHATADHFVLLLRNKDYAIQKVKQALDLALKDEAEINLSEIISCNYGVFEIIDHKESVASMISKANLALSNGTIRDGIAFYDDVLLQKLTRENLLAKHMHFGIENNEYQVYLQPKFDLFTGKLVGAEVLCRWISDTLGFLPPDEFIPLFEKNGFIVNLDFYMLEKTCQNFAPIIERAGINALPFSINFSRVTLLQDDFVDRFTTIVERYGLPPRLLEIEVTESAFIIEEGAMIRILEYLKTQGFLVSMDDFGLGYSSLNLLRKLPIDILKIDKEFLKEGGEFERTGHVIACIVQMAHELAMQVVCEGVENKTQVEFLKQIGCEIGQGYYFSKPISLDEFHSKYNY